MPVARACSTTEGGGESPGILQVSTRLPSLEDFIATWAFQFYEQPSSFKGVLSIVVCRVHQLQITESVVPLVPVEVVNDFSLLGDVVVVQPPNQVMFVAVSLPILLPRIILRGHNHLIRSILHGQMLTNHLRYLNPNTSLGSRDQNKVTQTGIEPVTSRLRIWRYDQLHLQGHEKMRLALHSFGVAGTGVEPATSSL